MIRGLFVLLFIALLGVLPLHAAQDAVVRLPSEAAGGGTLGLYLQWPDTPAEDRYIDGAPVVVAMHGGAAPGSLSNWSEFVDGAGFVVVQFVFPGGEDNGVASGGVYDYRGPVCALAARDVWLFALGLVLDEQGRTIHDVVGRTVRTELMGVEATSNGTMITPVVLDTYQQELVGRVRWISLWENIGSDQVRTVEIGRSAYDCRPNQDGDGNGLPDDEGKNPVYDPFTDYAYTETGIDYSSLVWDPSETQTINDQSGRFESVQVDGILFFDGNGNAALDHVPLIRGCTDVDASGVIEPDEDWFVANPIPEFLVDGTPRLHYSRPATRYLAAHPEVFGPDGWPGFVATPGQAEAFHHDRTANDHYHHLGAYARTLRTLSSFDEVPHFYVTADYLEVRIEQDGLAQAGLWRRLNPDEAYFGAWHGSVPAGYPDSPANIVVPIGDLRQYAAPSGQGRNDLVIPAACELSDRTYFGGWIDQLDGVLSTPAAPALMAENLRFDTETSLSWDEAPNNLFYDLTRGDVDELRVESGIVELGATSCIEEDSRDLSSADTNTPTAGRAWFYLVRPNAIAAGFGASSSGQDRDPGATGCLH